MSTGALGTIGSVATGQLQQTRSAEADRTTHDVSNQSRHADSNQRANDAAGIGETQREGETSERDADGRRLWEHSSKQKKNAPEDPSAESETTSQSKDPSGVAGGQIDLTG